MTDTNRTGPLSGPILVHVTRGELVESAHAVAAVITRPDGTIEASWGDVTSPFWPRSTNKPLQLVGMLRAGLTLEPRLTALATSSHSGEPFQLAAVREILAGVGLDVDALANTPDFPYDPVERDAWIAAGRGPEPIGQDCSGKHAGMLATCVAAGWPVGDYLDAAHPLQRGILTAIEDLAGEAVASVSVDGCGAPLAAISLAGLARAYGVIARAADGSDEALVREAMTAHPEYVAGTRRDVTALMATTPGVVAKDGAEAVMAVGLPDGRGIAVKVIDGSDRARPPAMAALLTRLGIASPGIDAMASSPVLGHGRPVGSVAAISQSALEDARNRP